MFFWAFYVPTMQIPVVAGSILTTDSSTYLSSDGATVITFE